MIQGQRIWDVTRVLDRENTRMELTDLVRFREHWYCGFREAEIHSNHPSGRARVIRSTDGAEWRSVAVFDWQAADVREPNFSVTAEGVLMVNTSIAFVSETPRADGKYYQLGAPGAPACDKEAEVARQSVTWLSRDGVNWSGAHACPTGVNTWRWHVCWHNGMGYSVGYSGKDKAGTLYRTRDGKTWRVLLGSFLPGGLGNEATLAFDADDTAICVVRDGRLRGAAGGQALRQSDGHEVRPAQARATHGTSVPMLGIGKAPYYQEWEWRDLGMDWAGDGRVLPVDDVLRAPLGGPKLLRLTDGRFVVAGRVLGPERDDGHITLFRLDPAEALLTRWAEFDGATYGGVAEHDGRVWVSYGASDVTGIFLASVAIE